MEKICLSSLFVLCTLPLLGQQDSLAFPAAWAGEWYGDLVISNGTREVQRLPMVLRILPQEDGRYTYGIIYGEEIPENTRPYALASIDASTGHYIIDEDNSIVLDGFLIGGKLYSRFEVMGSLLLSTLEERDGNLLYEIIAGPLAPIRMSGDTIIEGEEIPPVNSYKIQVQQRAVLKKKS